MDENQVFICSLVNLIRISIRWYYYGCFISFSTDVISVSLFIDKEKTLGAWWCSIL